MTRATADRYLLAIPDYKMSNDNLYYNPYGDRAHTTEIDRVSICRKDSFPALHRRTIPSAHPLVRPVPAWLTPGVDADGMRYTAVVCFIL